MNMTVLTPTDQDTAYYVYPDDDENILDPSTDSYSDKSKDINNMKSHYSDKDFISKYDDFQTIDWQRDLARDRHRRRTLRTYKSFSNPYSSSSSYNGQTGHHDDAREAKIKSFEGKLGRNTYGRSIRNMIYTILITHDAWSGWLCLLFVGLTAGLFAGFIDIGSSWLIDLKTGLCQGSFWFNREQCCWSANDTTFDEEGCTQWHTWPEVLGYYKHNPLSYLFKYMMYTFWALIFSGMSVFLVKMFAPYACGSGMPEIKTILSGFIIRGYLGKWTLIIKTITIMLAVSSGLTLGKEGPMVHLACCIGNIFSYLFPKYGKNEAKKREILSAAAAAGVSVAFGAPIGGVLFSLEEISYYFPMKTLWRSFFCAMVAAFVLRWINPFGNDHLVSYYVDFNKPWFMFELVPFIALGVFGGIVGAFFIKANYFWCKFRKTTRLGKYPVTEVLTITLITAIVCFPNPYTRESMNDLISELYQDCSPTNTMELCHMNNNLGNNLWKLLIALVIRTTLLIFTFGIKIPAGLFIPSLAIGACAGRIFGIGMEQLVMKHHNFFLFKDICKAENLCITPGLYAMVGSAAVLGGITRMTVSLVVIMFEVTGGSQYIVPLMAAVMMAKWVGDALCKEGIYEVHIHLNNYPFLDYKDEAYPFSPSLIAGNVMKPRKNGGTSLITLTANTASVEEVEKLVKDYDFNGYPVIVSKESPYLVGYVVRKDLQIALEKARRLQSDLSSFSLVRFASDKVIRNGRNPIINHQLNNKNNNATNTNASIQSYQSLTDTIHPNLLRNLNNKTTSITGNNGKNTQHQNVIIMQEDTNAKIANPIDLNYENGSNNSGDEENMNNDMFASQYLDMTQILDLAPITVTDQTPMETVIDMFRKLGLRQILITHNGQLLGIITKKDILVHLKQMSRAETQPLLDQC